MKITFVNQLIIGLVLLSSVAKGIAQPSVPAHTISQVKNTYIRSICNSDNRLNSFLNNIKMCYQHAEKNSAILDQCLLMDVTLSSLIQYYSHQSNMTANMLEDMPFINDQEFTKRTKKYLLMPQYRFLKNEKSLMNYFSQGIESLKNAMKKCKTEANF